MGGGILINLKKILQIFNKFEKFIKFRLDIIDLG